MNKCPFKNIWNKESNTPFAVMNNIFSDTWNLDKGFKEFIADQHMHTSEVSTSLFCQTDMLCIFHK